MLKKIVLATIVFALAGYADDDNGRGRCNGLPTASQLKNLLGQAVTSDGEAGGLFHGTRMWAAVVNR